MKVKISYTIGDVQDSYVLEGDTVQEIQIQNEEEMKRRGLDSEDNDMYSEVLN